MTQEPPEPAPDDLDRDDDDDEREGPSPEELAARRRLDAAGWKLIVIAAGSAVIPVAGVIFAAFALVAALSTRRRARAWEAPRAASRATLAAGLALAAAAWQGLLAWMWWSSRGGV